ncbi:MAG: hypothetical protein EON92_18660 [Burkholderiales bacterium]|nr:MAG: hypothetical protein EON92_18660 [Burkholderiales bacterium]
MQKIDITQRMKVVDDLIARTTNRRHWAILNNYKRHADLEVCGMWEGILEADMMVEHPVYKFHSPAGLRVLDGMAEVRAEYIKYATEGSSVMYHTDERITVSDEGFYTEYMTHRFYPGHVLAEQGVKVDKPDAVYLSSNTQMMFWPYDADARCAGERVYRGADRVIRLADPQEIVTLEECREKLLPTLPPVASPHGPDRVL